MTTLTQQQIDALQNSLNSNDIAGFYTLLNSYGDPYAQLGYEVTTNSGWQGEFANLYAQYAAQNNGVDLTYGSPEWLELNSNLANEYFDLIDSNSGQLPDWENIQEIHNVEYDRLNLDPDDWFPNTMLNSSSDPASLWGDWLANDNATDILQDLISVALEGGDILIPPVFMLHALLNADGLPAELAFVANLLNAALNLSEEAFEDFLRELLGDQFVDALGDRIHDLGDWLNDLAAGLPPGLHDNLPSWLAGPGGLFGNAPGLTSPLMLDLQGDGFALTALGATAENGSAVYYDLDADGFAERTGWVLAEGLTNNSGTGGDDAFLVIDRNGNGVIDDQSEMFGNNAQYADGFASLAAMDTNSDGVIDVNDAGFDDLTLWLDRDGDGVTDEGELYMLADFGIASINVVPASTADSYVNENLITAQSSFTRVDGTTGTVADIWFRGDDMNTRYQGDFTLDIRTLFLPTLRGFGDLPDLHIAMSGDEVLLTMVQDFITGWSLSDLGDPAALNAQITDILYRWAGVDDVDPASMPSVDAQVMGFMEAITGNQYGVALNGTPSNPGGPAQVNAILNSYEMVFDALKAHLVMQAAGAELFEGNGGQYNVLTGALNDGTFSYDALGDLASAANASGDAQAFWMEFATMLHQVKPLGLLSAQEQGWFNALTIFTSGQNWQHFVSAVYAKYAAIGYDGTEFSDHMVGGAGNDYLYGEGGNDVLEGGAGSDGLFGRLGDDTLIGGAGNDNLYGEGGNDTLLGGEGDDDLRGGTEDDVLIGGVGNDELEGGSGNDTYVYNLDDGSDVITEAGGVDRLVFGEGITAEDIRFVHSGHDLLIYIGGEILRLVAHYHVSTASFQIETLELADGTVIDFTADMTFTGTDAGESLLGLNNSNDTLYGLEGDDRVLGYSGDDVLIGGAGNDELEGGSGNDTYIYNLGDGSDVIFDEGGIDRLVFGEGITAEDIRFIKPGSDLLIHIGDDVIALRHHYQSHTNYRIEAIELFDGTIIDLTSDMTYTGTDAGETLFGQSLFGDTIFGLGGDDNLYGYGGDDHLHGGDGADRAYGGDGDDFINGGLHDDELRGDAGNDILEGSYGHDLLYGGDGNDVLVGGEDESAIGTLPVFGEDPSSNPYSHDDDRLYGGNGGDILLGYNGDDRLYGEADDDALYGGKGADILDGGSGHDYLNGENGSDTIYGRDGNDLLIGGKGADILNGGAGADTFAWFAGDMAGGAVDTIADFNVTAGDVLDVSGLLSDFDPLTNAITDFIRITDDGDDSFLSIDVDGGGDNFIQIAMLTNVTGLTNEQSLFDSGNLVV